MSTQSEAKTRGAGSDASWGNANGELAPGSRRGLVVYLQHLLSVGYFFGGGLVLTLLWPLLRIFCRRDRTGRIGSELVQKLFRGYIWLVQELRLFRMHWPDAEAVRALRGRIVVSNHPGLMDAVFLVSQLPRAVCVMRSALMRNPCFFGAARMAAFIPNDRGAEMIRESVDKLHAGFNLLIFPEGTRSKNGVLNPFRAGFALAAVRSGATVQCLIMRQSQPYLTRGLNVFEPETAPVAVAIRVGREFTPEPGESARSFAARVEAYFREELAKPGPFDRANG
jgi:1-acyl-sn-glycerol-3-phosphate acyltransferase